MTEAFPLQWPAGVPRTAPYARKDAPFTTTLAISRDDMAREVRLMGGSLPVISTNVALRRDGLPYSGQRTPDDPGVALYFQRRGKSMVFACDRWRKVEHNMRAIVKTIEALRGIERWGSADMVEQAFSGFVGLPAPSKTEWWREVLGLPAGPVTAAEIDAAFRARAAAAHPDTGGSDVAMANLNRARADAKASIA